MMIALLGVAGLAVATPALAVWVASAVSKREETAGILADGDPSHPDALALKLWSTAVSGDRHHHHGRSAAHLHQHT
jgi:hypothetical protein